MYKVQEIGLFNILGQIKVNNILFDCGKDMVKKYDLHHWDNSHFKNFIIIALCELKNSIYLVTENGMAVATFQIKQIDTTIHFEKLACSPKYSGKGIGSYCLACIEKMARNRACKKVTMEVYSPSQHALDFYLHKGYEMCGETQTLKYSEVKMEKRIL